MNSQNIDKYGFVCEETIKEDKISKKKEEKLAEEWEFLMKNWTRSLETRFEKIKEKVRKGIPNIIRGTSWYLIAGSEAIKNNYPENYYQTLITIDVTTVSDNDINADIGRTFPNNIKFKHKKGRNSLCRILKAYSLLDRELGYTQGMAFIAASFLIHLNEVDAFWLFVTVLTQYNLRDSFIFGMPKVNEFFYISNGLLRHNLPKVWKHFINIGIDISMYGTQWFMTGFCTSFSYETVVRIWDSFLFEGEKIFFRVFLAVLYINRSIIVKKDFEENMEILRDIGKGANTELIIKTAFKIHLSRDLIERLRNDYKNKPKEKYLLGINIRK